MNSHFFTSTFLFDNEIFFRSAKYDPQIFERYTLFIFSAGEKGFEPLNAGSKFRCLTTWLHPKKGDINKVFLLQKNRSSHLSTIFLWSNNSLISHTSLLTFPPGVWDVWEIKKSQTSHTPGGNVRSDVWETLISLNPFS